MPYADFTLDALSSLLGLSAGPSDLFPGLEPSPVPTWLSELLGRGKRQFLLSEKARSEFIVAPILLACQELCPGDVVIYSGQRLDVDPERGLIGECDFILSATAAVPALRSPLVTIVEAKKNDVDGGVWQCVAQMAGARLFNERAGMKDGVVFGCVTSGDVWQFLRLSGLLAEIDRRQYYIDNVGAILAAFGSILAGGAIRRGRESILNIHNLKT